MKRYITAVLTPFLLAFAFMAVGTAPAQAVPASPTISSNAVEHAAALANPDSFVVPMAVTYTDFLFCGQYGGKIYNWPSSDFGIAVYTGCANNGVPPGHWSNEWFAMRDVDYFYVGGGHQCRNVDTGHIYLSSASIGSFTSFRMLNDTVSLRLDCYVSGI